MTHIAASTIDTNARFEVAYARKVRAMLNQEPVNRGAAHATTDDTMASTHELLHVTEAFEVGVHPGQLEALFKPNLPWAEDHFRERIGGQPLNPSPSEAWWPFARQGNAEHKKAEVFSHTYPERFWPKRANGGWECDCGSCPHQGIRFEYGDLSTVISVLHKNIRTRQAYLPIWFPEDITAANEGQRVPCSMGYHFIYEPVNGHLDCVYTMRSCDIVRFYRDDLYMAGRLLQYVAGEISMRPGKLVVHIDNLHCFPGDRPFLEGLLPKKVEDKRSGYNFGALG